MPEEIFAVLRLSRHPDDQRSFVDVKERWQVRMSIMVNLQGLVQRFVEYQSSKIGVESIIY